jgi:ankyrin repeat protein
MRCAGGVLKLIIIMILIFCLGCSKGNSMNAIDYSKDYTDSKDIQMTQAVMAGDTNAVRRLAHEGVNLNAVGLHEITPLRTSIKVGQIKILRLLLELGANPNFKTPKGVAGADVAVIFQKNPEFLKLLLDFGLDPNLESDDVPLIFYALSEGLWRQYDMLLAKGADINSKTPDGSSLLLDLVMQLEYDRAKDLLLRGADFRVVTKHGMNVLDSLVDYQRRFCKDPNLPDCHKRAELLKLMQARGMEIPPGLANM